MRAALFCLLAACSPIHRFGLKRCPTVHAELVDFTVSTAAFAVSALAYNNGRHARAVAYAGVGLSVALAANLSECVR